MDDNNAFWRDPKYKTPDRNSNVKLNATDIMKLTKSTCILPNFILNDKCNECTYFSMCLYEKKRTPKHTKK